MNIITITLNPAYDIHAYTEQFIPFCENLAQTTSRDAGGKGINISRALNAVSVKNTAVVVLGKENGTEFKAMLLRDGINGIFLEKDGRIRENLTIHTTTSPETRISFSGFSLDNSIFSDIEEKLNINADTIVTFTGRIPDGISKDIVIDFLLKLKTAGVKLIIDSKSFSLEDLYRVKPWLIKPNEEEISAFFDYEIKTTDEALGKAIEISSNGIENTMVTLGDKGAILVSYGKAYHVKPPIINALSTIGAGDSTIAGFISAFISGNAPYDCLKTAVSFGTAACLTTGTQPPDAKQIEIILKQIS